MTNFTKRDERTWLNFIMGHMLYRKDLQRALIRKAGIKVLSTIGSIVIILESPYSIHKAHLNLVKIIVDYMGTFVKGVTIIIIGYLATDFNEPSSFFYMNTFVIMVINVFSQTNSHRDLLKVKVTGYFYFIMFSTVVTLIGCTFGVLWMQWTALHKNEMITSEKRAFIYVAYIVADSY
jgi:hypothetical protein